uniref:Uncharacterized protein n=1 Tax=Cacopsylla melanoneura TaxID=428564 RepID=A0A8D8LNQ5_9HEMI
MTLTAMRWLEVTLVVLGLRSVRGGQDGVPSQYEGQWQEIPPQDQGGQTEPDPEQYYEEELHEETPTQFVNPWTLPEEPKMFESDDGGEYKEEWEAQELYTTTTRKPYSRPTFNWTRRTWNWTTRPRTTRKMFSGITFNSSHCLCTDHMYQSVDRNDYVTNYVIVEKANYTERFLTYRQKQIAEFTRLKNELAKKIESMAPEEKILMADGFNAQTETDITDRLHSIMQLNKLRKEMEAYTRLIDNFHHEIESFTKLNQIDAIKDTLRKQIATINATNGDCTSLNQSYHDILNEREPLAKALNRSKIEYGEILDQVEHIKRKRFTKNDYEHEAFNIVHLLDGIELDLAHDRIGIESYEQKKNMLNSFLKTLRDKLDAVNHLESIEEEKYKSTFLKNTIKTNVPLENFIWERYHNRSLENLGKQLRNMLNVSSMEYEDDVTPDGNFTDASFETDDEEFTTLPYDRRDISHNLSTLGHQHCENNEYEHQDEHNENITQLSKHERTDFSSENNTQMRLNNEIEVIESGQQSQEEHVKKFKVQNYNVDLSEKYMEELNDLEEYVDAVHDKVNRTHSRFTQLWDRVHNALFLSDIVDKYNHQPLVKIFGIPGNFSSYPTREGTNLTELTVLQKIGNQLNKKLSIKKIKTAYQDLNTDYLRPPLIAEFKKYKDKLKWMKEYMSFILIKPRRDNELPIYTKLKLRPRIMYLPWAEFKGLGLKHRYDRFIIRDDLTDRANNLTLRIKRKMDEKGMRGTSIVWHNNSDVLFRRHFSGHVRRVRYYDNLDQLFEESKEEPDKQKIVEQPEEDILPEYLRKKTTSFGKRWHMLKCKRKNFFRPTKKRTTLYTFWNVVKKTTKYMKVYTTEDRKALIRKHKVW